MKTPTPSGIHLKLGSSTAGLKNTISKGIKLQAISLAERERLRIPSYEYILP